MREQIASHIPPRASRNTTEQPVHEDIEEDDSYYPHRMPGSARRYTTTQGQRVIQQGNRRIVIHDEPPPKKRSNHRLLCVGIGMVTMFVLWIGFQMFGNWWTLHQIDSQYGFPRTYQVDEVVGHSDSTDHPSHFIFENLHAHIIVIELPGGDASHAHIYVGPTLFSDNADSVPVTGEFKDVGNGKIDMIIHIGDQRIVYLNDGTQFKLQQ